MCMECRRRLLMSGGQKWELLMTNISHFYSGNVKEYSRISEIYINFPINKLVGSNSEYVIAFNDKLSNGAELESPIYIIPRTHINTSNLDNVSIPMIEYIPSSMDEIPTDTTKSSLIYGEGAYTTVAVSPNLISVSNNIANRKCYYINDVSQVPMIGLQAHSYEDGAVVNECSKGGQCNWTLYLSTRKICATCGDSATQYEYECSKCKEHVILQSCPNGC